METICKQAAPLSGTLEKRETREQDDPVVLCRSCSSMVAFMADRIQRDAGFSHTFANPHGHVFEIGCFSRARGCSKASPVSDEFSWFKGYVWAVAACRHCRAQLGWIFLSDRDQFFGLILDQLIFP